MNERWTRALASPAGVLITLPLLVGGAGLAVLLFGRDATRTVADTMARGQLAAQAAAIEREVGFALDQAGPMLDRLRTLIDWDAGIEAIGPRLYDIHAGRPGVANVSISYPRGAIRGTYFDGGELRVQESVVGGAPDGTGTLRRNFAVTGGVLRFVDDKTTDYDPRKRLHYQIAEDKHARAWTPPRVFFSAKTTGITCTEPVYADGQLAAVVTVDFDIPALSSYIVHPELGGARTVVYVGDGSILAYSAADRADVAPQADKLLRAADLHDPALDTLFAGLPGLGAITAPRFARLGSYLVSVAPLGGERAGVNEKIDWYVASLVPEATLLAPTRVLERRSVAVSLAALAVAVSLALIFAYYLNRMRRQVAASREAARSAEARARELGSYRLVARIGTGGMGEVWRAEHRLLARQAAIKLIRTYDGDDPATAAKDRERFRREAQTLAAMRSRHTIALFDYGVADDGTFFYVMELLDGLDLDSLVRQHGAQPAARVIDLMIQACSSLAEAHDAGLMHRDIKPANLFICRVADEVDVVKLLDFGIVHAARDLPGAPIDVTGVVSDSRTSAPALPAGPAPTPRLTQAGSVVGTPGYMPPEQAVGHAIDGRSDLYALGCVAWFLLTGNEVYPAETDAAVMFAHLYEDLPDLHARTKGWMPPELVAVMGSCLAKKPADRPVDARALADRLRAIPTPADHAWTLAEARAWWESHHPAAVGPLGAPSNRGQARILVPVRSERGTTVAESAIDAATIRGTPVQRGRDQG